MKQLGAACGTADKKMYDLRLDTIDSNDSDEKSTVKCKTGFWFEKIFIYYNCVVILLLSTPTGFEENIEEEWLKVEPRWPPL